MTTDQLYAELNYVSHSRANRLKYANLMLSQRELIPDLLDILFMVDDLISCRAAWVLEFMCGQKLESIIPHLDQFTEHVHNVHLDSAVRPVAKICEYLSKAYYSKTTNSLQDVLTHTHQERIIEVCFDWLINDGKIAPKAYAMNALYLFGKDFDWIHPELAILLERDFQMQSSGFKARARHILKKIRQV